MRAHQVFHPDAVYGYARLLPVVFMVHDDDFVERHAASILAAAVLARAEQLALMPEDGAAAAKNARVGETVWPRKDSQRLAQSAVTHFRARDFSVSGGIVEVFKVDPVLPVRLDDEGVRIKVAFGRVNPMKAAHIRQ